MLWKQLNFKMSRHHDRTPDRSTAAPDSAAKMVGIVATAEVATGDNDLLWGNNPLECAWLHS